MAAIVEIPINDDDRHL